MMRGLDLKVSFISFQDCVRVSKDTHTKVMLIFTKDCGEVSGFVLT